MNFRGGSHDGESPDHLLGSDDSYLIWVANCKDWSNKALRNYIIENLLSSCVQSKFKKHPNKSLSWIKKHDPKYFEYMRSNDSGYYLNLVE